MSGRQTVTTGLEMPSDFPIAAYNAIHQRVEAQNQAHPASWTQYSGAWNAITYRFHACADHAEAFTAAVAATGSAPPPPDRYVQEREFFNFLVNGLATIESLCYGLFAIGSMVDPVNFAIATDQDLRRITPKRTGEQYRHAFPSEDVTTALGRLVTSPDYTGWKAMRDLLAHRSVPGRLISVGASVTIRWGKGPAHPSPPPPAPPEEGQARWTTGIVIDANTTALRRSWLAGVITDLLDATSTFVTSRL